MCSLVSAAIFKCPSCLNLFGVAYFVTSLGKECVSPLWERRLFSTSLEKEDFNTPLGKGCLNTSLGKEVFSTMAKRLRGWQLEIETVRTKQAKAGKALGKAEGCVAESALANKLLFLWARGTLSATLIRELADCAIQDGAQHTDLVASAQTGNWGAQPGNVHRQIPNHFCSMCNLLLAASHDVEAPCTHPKTSKDALEKASIFLPHMMFCCLCQSYPEIFYRLFCFGKGKLASFWKGVAKTEDEKLKGHPMTLKPGLGGPQHPIIHPWRWCGLCQQ